MFWMARKTPTEWDDRILQAIEGPLPSLIFVTGLYHLLGMNAFTEEVWSFVRNAYAASSISLIMWAVYRLVDTYDSKSIFSEGESDGVYAPYVLRLFKVSIVMITSFFVLEQFGYDLTKFLAGIGITGIVFAFAARDTFANIFSGMVLVIEKPFSVGDVISTKEIDGTVLDINFRSTTVRTLDHLEIVVPNSNLVNSNLTNKSKSDKRKVHLYIGIKKRSRSEKLSNSLRNFLSKYEDIESESISFRLDSVTTDYTLFHMEFTSTQEVKELIELKQKLLQEVVDIADLQDLDLSHVAFEKPPVQT